MYKTFRVMIAISLVLGIAVLAQDQVAWANHSTDQSLSATNNGRPSVAAASRDPDCDKEENKDKKKCKGTVKPPPGGIIIPVTGEYSVGGFCTLIVELIEPGLTLNAIIETPLPGDLPNEVQKIRQGCLLTYHDSNQTIIHELSQASGNTTICFAAIPSKQMTIYFYNIYAPDPVWAPLQTNVLDGIVCAAANASGVYVATFQKT